jgi:hypothetical protein
MTVREILQELDPVKPMTRETLYTHLKALKIKPIGARQIPARYPDNTPTRILKRLGLLPAKSQRRAA